ncbi:uncharacterized protein LOC141601391 isoform X2 [Silene latifolia]|uniref:uncharacterized protein LOC141601391 isoform X2 n=1 Tax=Silene latifolia TaxID=37657 RepID=UPI003D77FFD8
MPLKCIMTRSKNKKKGEFEYYVVWRGRKPGICDKWHECKEQVSGFSNNNYKGFRTLKEAWDEFHDMDYTNEVDFSASCCPNCVHISQINYLKARVAYLSRLCADQRGNLEDLEALGAMLEKTVRLDHQAEEERQVEEVEERQVEERQSVVGNQPGANEHVEDVEQSAAVVVQSLEEKEALRL